MARYLAYTSPARGHLYPIVATLLELRDRGHDVHVRTLASELDALRALGLHAEPIAAAIEAAPLRDFEASSPEEALGKALATFADRARHEVPDLQRAIDDVAPDALLIDITTVGAAALAEAVLAAVGATIPLFQRFSPDPSIPSTVTRVPFGIVPEPGLAVINGPRAQLDLRPLAGPEEIWRAPLHLYYTARPFELDLALPAVVSVRRPRRLGAARSGTRLAGRRRRAARARQRLQRAPARRRAHPNGPRRAPRRERRHRREHRGARPRSASTHPANARVERWLPHGQLLAKAACTICHGGMGIAQKTLAAGVPACVVPFGRDQFEVGARVAAVGAGTCLAPDALNAQALRAAVDQALGMRHGAESVADAFAQAGGAMAAASALESQLTPAPTP